MSGRLWPADFARTGPPSPRRVTAGLAVFLLTLAAGCTSVFPPLVVESEETGHLAVAVRGAAILQDANGILRVELYTAAKPKSDDKPAVVKELSAAGFDGEVRFHNIAVRNWHVRSRLLDGNGAVVYEGAGSASMNPGETSRVALELHPVPGELIVSVDVGEQCIEVGHDECLQDVKRNGLLVVHKGEEKPLISFNFDLEAGTTELTLKAQKLPPGTYDFRVGIYRGSRISGNELVGGTRYGLNIYPGRTTTVLWRPDLGMLDLEVTVAIPPTPPENLELEVDMDGGLVLRWQPPPEPVLHYVVYARAVGNDWFCKATETDGPTLYVPPGEALVCAGDTDPGEPDLYVVTAVGPEGYESFRSNYVAPPPQRVQRPES